MKLLHGALAAALVFGFAAAGRAEDKKGPLDSKLKDIDGKEYDLAKLKGKVVLFVNVASECGYTPQYEGLQELYAKYGKDGFVIVGIPSNEFGEQEPGSDAEIKKFCSSTYKVTFPLMTKSVIKGKNQIPLYKALVEAAPNGKGEVEQVGWNFEKFLVSREGKVVGRFKSTVAPNNERLIKAIRGELEKSAP